MTGISFSSMPNAYACGKWDTLYRVLDFIPVMTIRCILFLCRRMTQKCFRNSNV